LLFPIHEVVALTKESHQRALDAADEHRQLASLLHHRRAVERLHKALSRGIAAGVDVGHIASEFLNIDRVREN